jgi:hypothetical protein
MLAQCKEGFADGKGVPGTDSNYNPFSLPCTIIDQDLVNSCANSLVAIGERASGITGLPIDPESAIKAKADANIRKMVQLRQSRGNWGAWRTAATRCGLRM